VNALTAGTIEILHQGKDVKTNGGDCQIHPESLRETTFDPISIWTRKTTPPGCDTERTNQYHPTRAHLNLRRRTML